MFQIIHQAKVICAIWIVWSVAGKSFGEAYEIQRSIPYKTLSDDKELLADVYLPTSTEAERHPTILMIHGGAWFSGNKVHVTYHAKHAATQGFAVVAINYRLAPKYKFPAQVEDCLDALAWIRKHADKYSFDANRVAVYGYSAGAHLASLVGVTRNNEDNSLPGLASLRSVKPEQLPTICAVVAGGAPCEFSWIPDDSEALSYWLGSSRAANPEIYVAASPSESVDEGDPPTLLFHGTADRVVPLDSAKKMAARLEQAKVPYKLHEIPEASHIGAFMDASTRQVAVEFLRKHLLSE